MKQEKQKTTSSTIDKTSQEEPENKAPVLEDKEENFEGALVVDSS